ncbi:BON1-associated protein 2-like [Momordica charantia]|uniref:BON1-associated protein 2-like n=1 Tax=Momordica charantia TaxID=3673 RepID=A0A6J1D0R9_MOMCH|nr:BON1-associated protein 2-like [Momordica charantia]
MASISRTLQITVISAEDLSRHRKSLKKNSFATVRIDSQNIGSTLIDGEGGSYPFWNHKIEFNLPSNVSFITVDVHCGNFSRNKIVGTTRVPVSDFLGGSLPETYLHILSYRLRDVRGNRNGIVNISVRVTAPDVVESTPRTAKLQAPSEKINFGTGAGVAVGIPFWSGSGI